VGYRLEAEQSVAPLLTRVHEQLLELYVSGWTAPDGDNLRALGGGAVDVGLSWVVDPIGGHLRAVTVARECCLVAVHDGYPLGAGAVVPAKPLAAGR